MIWMTLSLCRCPWTPWLMWIFWFLWVHASLVRYTPAAPGWTLWWFDSKPFSVGFLDLLALLLLPCRMRSSLAPCSTHYEHELSPGTFNVSLILVQVSQCWSSLTIIDWHLVIPFGFLLSVSGSPRSVSNLSPSDILPTRLTKFSSFIYHFYVIAQ